MKLKQLLLLIPVSGILILTSCNTAEKKTSFQQVLNDSIEQVATETDGQAVAKAMEQTEKNPEQQQTKESLILDIRKEYQRIEAANLRANQVHYQDPDPNKYWNQANYMAYYEGDDLVKLCMEMGEEGYWSETELYMKNNEVFFIFRVSSDPEGFETRGRFYFHEGVIIEALIKEGMPPLDEMKNQPHPILQENLVSESAKMLEFYKKYRAEYESVK